MHRIGRALCLTCLLVVAGVALAGNGKGKPGGGGDTPPADPAIVFMRSGASGGIMVMNADGSNETLVLAGDMHRQPTWSPDGGSIVFFSSVQGNGIYVVDLDGSSLRKVVATNSGIVTRPVWSPVTLEDGREKIAFTDQPVVDGVLQDDSDLFLVNPDGTGLVNLTDSADAWEVYPSWSPDASRLAVKVIRAGAADDLVVLTLGAGLTVSSRRNLTDPAVVPTGLLDDFDIRYPMWANLGERIAVSASDGTAVELWIFDLADEAVPVRVTNTASIGEAYPSWSPDDGTLACLGASQKGREEGIYVVDLGDGSAKRIRSSAGGAGSPIWRRNP